ncbi:hypothetical protein HPB50_027283 [Hyalomma asiaticum]|uniref:Uncharacterized protein n=1 Tax=Hyalomma asiaticum TaxID=266040 RepID=A0ACB7TCB2_HYAAI|nr:hypothetical protein HPB50_027283 [Hyalomma asiaticum]
MAVGGGTHEMMQALLEQNRRLLELIERKPEAFHVMPDLNKAIYDFDGEGSSHEAGAWLKSIDSMAVLHGWPDSSRLENARLHMKGPARFWLQSRVDDLTTWEGFKTAFTKTSVGQTSSAETIPRSKFLVGLRFKDACISMSSKDHKDEDELLADLRKLERIIEARMQQYQGPSHTVVTQATVSPSLPSGENPAVAEHGTLSPRSFSCACDGSFRTTLVLRHVALFYIIYCRIELLRLTKKTPARG